MRLLVYFDPFGLDSFQQSIRSFPPFNKHIDQLALNANECLAFSMLAAKLPQNKYSTSIVIIIITIIIIK